MSTRWIELFFDFLEELCAGLGIEESEERGSVADERTREIINSLTKEQALRLKKFFIKESEEALYELASNLNKGLKCELLSMILKKQVEPCENEKVQ